MTTWCFGVSITPSHHESQGGGGTWEVNRRGSVWQGICQRRAYFTHISVHKEATTCLRSTDRPPVSHTTVQPLRRCCWTPPSRIPGGEGGMKSYPVVTITHRTRVAHPLLTVSPQLVLLSSTDYCVVARQPLRPTIPSRLPLTRLSYSRLSYSRLSHSRLFHSRLSQSQLLSVDCPKPIAPSRPSCSQGSGQKPTATCRCCALGASLTPSLRPLSALPVF